MTQHHSALDNGVSRLFHYQRYNAEHLKATLQNQLIRFAPPGEFNDPWDCKPLFHVPEDEEGICELVTFMYQASERRTPNFDATERRSRAAHYLRNPDALRKDLVQASAEMWAQMNRRYRLYCLSTKPDCSLMWAHYADHHRGVCLEFNVRTRDICSAIQVNYSVDYPKYSLSDGNDLSPFYSKSADWTYEEEYRLVAQEEREALGAGTLMTRDCMYQYPSDALISIIIGCCAPPNVVQEISETAHATGILVRKATRVTNRYALIIDPPI